MIKLLMNIVATILHIGARILLALKKPRIVAVTGSVGKTSTKLAIGRVLSAKYTVLAHPHSYNTEFGLPLSFFNLNTPSNVYNPLPWLVRFFKIGVAFLKPYPYEVVVLEMGADKPGDIERFMKYIHPEIGVLTAVQPVHTELFGSLEAVYQEKTKLAHGSAHVVANADDELLRERLLPELQQKYTTYGVYESADWRPSRVFRNQKTGTLNITLRGKTFGTKIIARHGLNALMAAAAVGEQMGVEKNEIYDRLAEITPTAGRMQLLRGKRRSYILDDSYNASPRATVLALQTLKDFPGQRKIAILGNMNELGDLTEEGHRHVGEEVAKLSLDYLYTIGETANDIIVDAAVQRGFAKNKTKTFTSPYAAGLYVAKKLEADDVVLVKGSQNGVFGEEAVARLLARQADRKKLVRQGAKWHRVKRGQFPDAPKL